MAKKRILTLEEANQELQRLAASGVRVYDLRGKPADEQEKLVEEIKDEIARLRSRPGKEVDDGCPLWFVAGSGKTEDKKILDEARATGECLQAIVNGGSQYSVMGATAEGAKLKIGVTCSMIMPFEMPDERYDMLVIVDGEQFKGLENRLKLLRELTSKEQAIHGGIGTLEELLGGIGVREHLSLLTPYWSPVVETFKKMYSAGYIAPQVLDRIHPGNGKQGTEVSNLSADLKISPDAAQFRQAAEHIAQIAKTALLQRPAANVHVLDGNTPLNGALATNNFFVLPPGDITALHQATMIMVEKRIALKFKATAPNPGIAEKPLIVLNVDGFYDEFMQKLRDMEQGKYLMEPLSKLITEIKIDSHAQAADIRDALTTAIPHDRAPVVHVTARAQSGAATRPLL